MISPIKSTKVFRVRRLFQSLFQACLLAIGSNIPLSAAEGNYTNPVLHADYSDPDVVRVGEDYWMTSSSFNHVPGLPLLHSRDLVDWSLEGYALPRLVPEKDFENPRQGGGVWAPSIRHHDGLYRIYYPDPDSGIYVVTAKDPHGPWSDPVLVKGGKGLIDPCPFRDKDGKVYLIHAWAKSRAGFANVLTLLELDSTGTKFQKDLGIVIDGNALPGWTTLEGPKIYRIGEWYYVFAPAGGVKEGWQAVFRSKDIQGPYEHRIVMDQGITTVNGPHQGALVDTPSGEWWFLHFQDKGAYGRIVHLEPVSWNEGWPVIGFNRLGSGKGEPVMTYPRPRLSPPPSSSPPESDEFDHPELSLPWQWQANPKTEWWSLSERPGFLRLCSRKAAAPNLWASPSLLLRKFPSERFTVTTEVDAAMLEPGGRAGLVVFGSDYACLVVKRVKKAWRLSLSVCKSADRGKKEEEIASETLSNPCLFLRCTVLSGAICRFSYSLDGRGYRPIGEGFEAKPGRWVGAKIGIFAESEAPGGSADFNAFTISSP